MIEPARSRTRLQPVPPTARQPQTTRQRLIDAAFAEVHRHGLGPTGLDAILERAELTKGAVYHHFRNKQELGLAVFDEVVVPWVRSAWIESVRDARDPLKELTTRVRGLLKRTAEERSLGCPLNNLIQELGGTEPAFQERINRLLEEWRAQLSADIERAQAAGQVRAELRPKDTAAFLVAALEGVVGVAKPAADLRAMKQAVAGFTSYLGSLRSDG